MTSVTSPARRPDRSARTLRHLPLSPRPLPPPGLVRFSTKSNSQPNIFATRCRREAYAAAHLTGLVVVILWFERRIRRPRVDLQIVFRPSFSLKARFVQSSLPRFRRQ